MASSRDQARQPTGYWWSRSIWCVDQSAAESADICKKKKRSRECYREEFGMTHGDFPNDGCLVLATGGEIGAVVAPL